jgi:PAS domain S-box-containing protein
MQAESKVNILLVDDYPENLLALEAILERLGQNLVKANSGQEALRCLLNQDFAVILLDVQMPGMDGFETATLIRNRERSRDTPIIFLTAFSSNEAMIFKGYSLGAVDYLIKPVEPAILISKVTVFVDLFKKREKIKQQAAELAAVNSELKKSEEKFSSLTACSPIGIFLLDLEGRCTYTNPRCQELYGLTFEESLGDGWLQSVHPDDRDRVFADLSSWALRNSQYSNEFRLQTSEGNIRWVHLQISPMLSPQNQLSGHVGTIEDITERQLAEQVRAQVIREQSARQQAESANRMKDEFLATLSHELRTPLNSVLGWAKLLRTRSFDQNTTERALETIERNAKSQAQLIDDILDISRLIRGKLHLKIRPINLIYVIEAAVEAVRLLADAKSIQLEQIFDFNSSLCQSTNNSQFLASGSGSKRTQATGKNSSKNEHLKNGHSSEVLQINGDSDRLQQVLWNLLSNAIKFTPEKGKIQLRCSCTGTHAKIDVIDTGKGISKEFLPYVFDRFRQEDSSMTRNYGGLGLGLAIVRNLVEMHSGKVYADSEGEGKGSTFTVEIPLSKNPDPEQPTLSPNCTRCLTERSDQTLLNLSGLQVLIVDDDPDVRELLTMVISEQGAKAITTESVTEALQVLENVQPDVLLSDIAMPDQDGYALIRQVRTLEVQRGGLLPAIALTAYAREEDCQEAISSGFQMHMSKPVDTTKLVLAVAKLAGQTVKGNG